MISEAPWLRSSSECQRFRRPPQLNHAPQRPAMRPGQSYYNDPDQLLIGSNGLSRTEAEVQMGMWCDSQARR
jgi:hypothetical protein